METVKSLPILSKLSYFCLPRRKAEIIPSNNAAIKHPTANRNNSSTYECGDSLVDLSSGSSPTSSEGIWQSESEQESSSSAVSTANPQKSCGDNCPAGPAGAELLVEFESIADQSSSSYWLDAPPYTASALRYTDNAPPPVASVPPLEKQNSLLVFDNKKMTKSSKSEETPPVVPPIANSEKAWPTGLSKFGESDFESAYDDDMSTIDEPPPPLESTPCEETPSFILQTELITAAESSESVAPADTVPLSSDSIRAFLNRNRANNNCYVIDPNACLVCGYPHHGDSLNGGHHY